jgi:uncharacterized iron-regulated membrane protein
MTRWQEWVHHPEKSRGREILFQVHYVLGALVGLYIFLMSVSGSIIVYRTQLFEHGFSVERIVDLHANLLGGSNGRLVNGVGAILLTILCLTGAVIWWPGPRLWRRSLSVQWRAHFARINWDVHSAVGFWTFGFVVLWGVSGIYLTLPDQFTAVLSLNPAATVLSWLAELHFGRFGWLSRAIWASIGLVPAVLAFTGTFICCRRVILRRPSNPSAAVD